MTNNPREFRANFSSFTPRISIRYNNRQSTGDNQEFHRTSNADWRNTVNHQPSSMPYGVDE
jgi:hypothetical protein